MTPLEICDWLSYHVSVDYRFIKFRGCTFFRRDNALESVFLYDNDIAPKLDALKGRLEKEFSAAVGMDIGYKFEYRRSYIDAQLLQMKVRSFLSKEYSILTLALDEDDIIVTETPHGFDINLFLPKQNIDYIENTEAFKTFIKSLHSDFFCQFAFHFNEKSGEDDTGALEKLELYMTNALPSGEEVKIDKVFKIKGHEYYLGKPIKERPIKIEFLKVSADEQTIAGTMGFLSKREYTSKAGEKKEYYTFVLDDGRTKISCVFFPTTNSRAKFDKLVNGTVICCTGINSERNGRVSFRVMGISFCELA